MPSENELAVRFELSRPSIRKVLSALAEEGLVKIERGKGTVVNDQLLTTETVSLFWPGPSFEYTPMKHVVERFNQVSKTIKVAMVPYSKGSTIDLLNTNNELKPDLIAVGNTSFLDLQLAEIEQYLQPISLPETDSIYPVFTRAFTKAGLLYSAPVTFTPIVLAFNKKLFVQAGEQLPDETWDLERLLESAKRLTLTEGQALPHSYGISFSTSLNRWPAMILANGGNFDDLLVSSEPPNPTIDALNYVVDLMYTHKVAPLYSIGNDDIGESMFIRGKVAMILTSYNFMEQFKQLDLDWGFCRIPSNNPSCSSLSISSGISISTGSNKKEAAMSFIRFVLSDSMQAYMKLASCSVPVVKRIATSRKYPHNPLGSRGYYTFEKLMDNIITLRDCSLTSRDWLTFQHELNLAWAGTMSMREALDSAQRLLGK
ncbi:MAG: transporter substrate-binding protein [Paenibacillus sp.]|nr:transporter substrate-binding protein [Paenibacillus sp.]